MDRRLLPVMWQEQSQLQVCWDERLTKSDENPFPLAPRDLVRMGLVTPRSYEKENTRFGLSVTRSMGKALKKLRQSEICRKVRRPEKPEINVFGWGLGRDSGWFSQATSAGFQLRVHDASAVSLDLLSINLAGTPYEYSVDAVRGDVEETWTDAGYTVAYYACQFIQVQDDLKMVRLMNRLGEQLVANPGRQLYLVHAFNEDNATPRAYCGVDFPHGVEWGNTNPYTQTELLRALGDSRHMVDVSVLSMHRYFHQHYALLRFVRARV